MLPTGVDEIVYCGYLANYWIGFTFFNFTAESHSLGSPAPWPLLSFLALAGWCMLDWILMGGNYAVIAQALFGSGLLPALKFT